MTVSDGPQAGLTSPSISTSAASPGSAVAIATSGLRKTYRTRRGLQVAVAGLDLAVPSGGVHGFLGPNGSGKTTTIRMLLGLIRADSGSMRLFDTEVPRALPEVIDRVGAIVESPKFFPNFSGRQNLRLLAGTVGAPKDSVERVLADVGLTARAGDAFRAYSLGMKQRLAIAATLLKDPDLLIFDEPTNGLDPAGIREVRETMRGLGRAGKTVLVSSHILAEVEQVADTVSIIGHGRLLASGRVDELIASRAVPSVRVVVADAPRAADLLQAAGMPTRDEGDHLIVSEATDPARITQVLAEHQLYVRELVADRVDLEDVFLALTADERLAARTTPSTPGGAR